MSALPFVILGVVLSLGAQSKQQPKKGGTKRPPPPQVVEVQIIVGTYKELSSLCLQVTPPPATAVLVTPEKGVYHCIGKNMHDHSKRSVNSNAMDPSDVKLVAGQRIRWSSNSRLFRVVSVVKRENPEARPQDKLAPLTPFDKFPEGLGKNVTSSLVPNLEGAVVVRQRYKVTFEIQGIGFVDPDVVCSM